MRGLEAVCLLIVLLWGSQIKAQLRIINGQNATEGQHRYLVSLREKGSFLCGASLISSKCVLTAAHCLDGRLIEDLEIYGGHYQLDQQPVICQIEFEAHPKNYNKYNFNLDVAILKLNQSIDAQKMEILEIDYRYVKNSDIITVIGWGDTTQTYFSTSSEWLLAANVTAMSQGKCKRAYAHRHTITKNMFCARGVNGEDACNGDSGGPAIRNGKLVGIVSWGDGCGQPHSPGVYTRLSGHQAASPIKAFKAKYC